MWSRGLRRGALVDTGALVPRSSTRRGQLPLSVTEGAAPADLAHGDVVDVWVGPGPGDEPGGTAVKVLESVRVLQVGDDAAAAAGALAQTVLVDVDEARLGADVVSTASSGHVTLVRVS